MLGRGEMFGVVKRALDLNEVTLTETSYGPRSRLESHMHRLPMFVFVVEGSYDETYDRRGRTCTSGRLVYRPPGERHAQHFLERGATCLTIELSMAFEGGFCGADGRLPLEGEPALSAMRIYDELSSPLISVDLVIEELVCGIVANVVRQPRVTERTPPRWLTTAREMIEEARGPITLTEVAAEVAVHRVHLSRTFSRYFGCTVGDYARRLRVHRACSQLRESRSKGSTVACDVGFADESHMGRAFRRVMRRSPRVFRQAATAERDRESPARHSMKPEDERRVRAR